MAINQDSLGKAATTFRPNGAAAPVSGQLYPYWAGQLSDGVVVALVVPGSSTQTLSVSFTDVPGLGSGSFSWTELYSGRTGSGTSVSATLGSHDIAVFKVVKAASTTSAGAQTTTRTTTVAQLTTTSNVPCSGGNCGQCASMWGQCGGTGWTVC